MLKKNCLLGFVQHGAQFWKCFQDYLDWASESLKKSLVQWARKKKKPKMKSVTENLKNTYLLTSMFVRGGKPEFDVFCDL